MTLSMQTPDIVATSGTLTFAPVQTIPLRNGPVAYRQHGTGFPLVLIHGWGGSSRYWQDTLHRVADIRHVYAPDLPGHGETPPLTEIASTERLAELVIEFADALGLEQFDLNGHSLGAAIAVYMAASQPQRVRRLVLTSLGIFRSQIEQLLLTQTYFQMSMAMTAWRPWLLLWRPWFKLWQPWVDWIGSQPAVYRAIAPYFLHQMPANEQLLREGVIEFLRTDRLTSLENAISAGSPAFVPALRKVTAPTLLIGADHDQVMPSSGMFPLAQQIPNCRHVELVDCGHVPMIEQAEEYHRLLREFLLSEE